MIDLRIKCISNRGSKINWRYDTIMDFLDDISDSTLIYTDVEATFFEKRKECFKTLKDLKVHCEEIVK